MNADEYQQILEGEIHVNVSACKMGDFSQSQYFSLAIGFLLLFRSKSMLISHILRAKLPTFQYEMNRAKDREVRLMKLGNFITDIKSRTGLAR